MLDYFDELTRDTASDSPVGDFGFWHDFETVCEVGGILLASECKILPAAGGWLDQPQNWADDLMTYLRLYQRAKRLKGNGPRDDRLLDQMMGGSEDFDDISKLLD